MTSSRTAPVSGFACSFLSGKPIPKAKITILEDKEKILETDSAGKFGPFLWPVGEPITLVCEKIGYKTTQTATIVVPPEGINHTDFFKNISFQVPTDDAYDVFAGAMGIAVDKKACQIAVTITPPGKTMKDAPQGIEGVTVTLSPDAKTIPRYLGVFPLIHKTNPCTSGLKATSLDGGVVFPNVPPGEYTVEAKKGDISFSNVKIKARAGVFVNASPPYGPTALPPYKETEEKKPNGFAFFQPVLDIGLGIADAVTCGLVRGVVELPFNVLRQK